MTKTKVTIVSCTTAMLLIAAIPILIGMIHGGDANTGFRVMYLRGLSTLLELVGAESSAYDVDFAAHRIKYNLVPVEVGFDHDLESRLIRAQAEIMDPGVREWGMESVYYSSGCGLYRFYIPESKVNDFESSMRRYKAELERKRLAGGQGYELDAVNMNQLLEWLAHTAKTDYVHNPDLDDSLYQVTGRISDVVDPLAEAQVIARAYNLKTKLENGMFHAWPSHRPEPEIAADHPQEAQQDTRPER